MVVYDRLWEYLKRFQVSQYRLMVSGLSHSTITRLKRNQAVSTETLGKICRILECRLEDIAEYVPDKEE